MFGPARRFSHLRTVSCSLNLETLCTEDEQQLMQIGADGRLCCLTKTIGVPMIWCDSCSGCFVSQNARAPRGTGAMFDDSHSFPGLEPLFKLTFEPTHPIGSKCNIPNPIFFGILWMDGIQFAQANMDEAVMGKHHLSTGAKWSLSIHSISPSPPKSPKFPSTSTSPCSIILFGCCFGAPHYPQTQPPVFG